MNLDEEIRRAEASARGEFEPVYYASDVLPWLRIIKQMREALSECAETLEAERLVVKDIIADLDALWEKAE